MGCNADVGIYPEALVQLTRVIHQLKGILHSCKNMQKSENGHLIAGYEHVENTLQAISN
jgi:hypothetical protein